MGGRETLDNGQRRMTAAHFMISVRSIYDGIDALTFFTFREVADILRCWIREIDVSDDCHSTAIGSKWIGDLTQITFGFL